MDAQPEKTAPLTLRLFGPFSAQVEGRPLPRLRTRKGQWLLALLALRPEREVERAWLSGNLWPESTEEQAAASLRQCLTDLRAALAGQAIRLQSPRLHSLRLALEEADVDTLAFDRAIERSDTESLAQAIALYQGALLEGCTEEWIFPERDRFRTAYLNALETLAATHRTENRPADAITLLRRAIAEDPLRENAHRNLMLAFAECGDYAAALYAYRELRLFLRREINAEPDAETTALSRRLRDRARERAEVTDPSRPLPPPLPNRPAAPSGPTPWLPPLIGRETEMRTLRARLSEARIVTLTGPGGIGKTRLAQEVVIQAADSYPDGVFRVDLTSVQDAAHLPEAVALALGLEQTGAQASIDTACDYLRPLQPLLLLDSGAHLIDATARFAESLLRNCPELTLLVTSRQALGLPGEVALPIPPLALPPISHTSDATPTPEELEQYTAIRFFLERAKATDANFRLTESNARSVAQICASLDGIPLALELIVGQLDTHTVTDLAAHFETIAEYVPADAGIASLCQEAFRVALDGQYTLLSPLEQAFLRRLAPFVDGLTLETAAFIAQETTFAARFPLASLAVLDLLSQLVDKSLLFAEETDTGMRFRAPATVRLYCLAHLRESGEWEQAHSRYAAWRKHW